MKLGATPFQVRRQHHQQHSKQFGQAQVRRQVLQLVLLYKASLLYFSLSLFLAFFRLPILFLYVLQTYMHPDAQPSTSNSLRAAIRRPSAPKGPASDLRKRPKNKDKLDFDEKNT
ncbi:hypothetical protein Ahy_B05g076508 [Arachis hypogaea]|uniref:Uncharacterized protein n=1 Tax=Arachis hypogaea TaxID=3818 RepID=A0A444Z3C6_ARAHY|nr:hypothetical protein Ahy_B05g076508 [Arachis hypogaea]